MRLVEQIFRLLAPHDCLGCGLEGRLLCGWCVDTALPETIGRCYRCGKLSANSAVCMACRRQTPLRHLWIRTEYSDTAKALIHAMKFKYSGEAADLIAVELANTLPALNPDTLIVNVPSIGRHIRQRGFDHMLRITRGLSLATGWTLLPALARRGHLSQLGSSRPARLEQMKDVFIARPAYPVKGANILLVDDVLTTGATLESAAKEIKRAGAKSVDAVVFAHVK